MTLVCGLQRTVSSSSSVSTIRSSSVSSSSSVTRRSQATSGTSKQTKQSSSSSVTEVKRALQSCSIQDNIGGRGRYSVNIQFNGDNNVKRIKIVWQSVKHVHFWQNSHNILAITKSPVSDLIILSNFVDMHFRILQKLSRNFVDTSGLQEMLAPELCGPQQRPAGGAPPGPRPPASAAAPPPPPRPRQPRAPAAALATPSPHCPRQQAPGPRYRLAMKYRSNFHIIQRRPSHTYESVETLSFIIYSPLFRYLDTVTPPEI